MKSLLNIGLACLCFLTVNAGDLKKVSVVLDWSSGITQIELPGGQKQNTLKFDGSKHVAESHFLPVYTHMVELENDGTPGIVVYNKVFEPIAAVKGLTEPGAEISVSHTMIYIRKQPTALIEIIPLRVDPMTGQWEKLVSFDMMVTTEATAGVTGSSANKSSTTGYAANSVLSSGTWYKIGVQETGVTKIDYQFLKDMGLNPDNIDPRNIRIHGNGGGILPEANSAFRHDDLVQNPIFIAGEQDGRFDSGDYILFYAQGPNQWVYQGDSTFQFETNPYDTRNYYFLTVGSSPGLRVGSQVSASGANKFTNSFDDYAAHELEETNLMGSGREFFGDFFNFGTTSRTFNFNFPNLITSEPVKIRTSVAGRSTNSNINFVISANGQQIQGHSIGTIGTSYTSVYANTKGGTTWNNFNSGAITIGVGFSSGSSSAEGWLNFIELNARRNLTFTGSQLQFRDSRTVGSGNYTEFQMGGGNNNLKIWDVTDPTNPVSQQYSFNGGQITFATATDELKEFVAFLENGSFPVPVSGVSIPNQNLHAIGQPDMLIVTVADLMSEANRLANHHRDRNNLSVDVVDVAKIYNEFSSGRQDISAIRDFVKMLYDRAGSNLENLPQYLLLFGDASYDYKNLMQGNQAHVPTYETHESLNPITSYCTDDFFGFLDDNEGNSISQAMTLDLAIGRLPVKNINEAANMVDKIIHYQSTATFGAWRNSITFIGDDEDGNTHFRDAGTVLTQIENMAPVFNLDKIFLDAYQQESTPAGSRYPEVKNDINRKIFTGTLVMDYVGHGGTNGWAHERILDLDDIRSWDNFDKMPLFITATCEFTRVDDPSKVSAGEEVMLNPNGGGIGLVSTTRLVYSYANLQTNKAVTKAMLTPYDATRMPTMGEFITAAKNELTLVQSDITNARKFVLIGDPAVTLAYPMHNVVTTKINNKPVAQSDTLKALEKVTISGEVHDASGTVMTGFNGTVYATIFDKPSEVKTLKNDDGSQVDSFEVQKNIIFRGRATVINGEFSFTFIVPIDISFAYGNGKISYYAENGLEDAHGYTDNVVIGGTADSIINDPDGPELGVFMNDLHFRMGGITSENPLLLIKLSDFSGINTAGNSVGHDITAVLDNDTRNTFVLNDYYEAAANNYQEGEVRFPMSDLEPGRHTIKVKAWDVFNNSAEGYTEFIVAESESFALAEIMNYPNPMVTGTNFAFEHNKAGETLFVEVKIFNASGQLVKTISETIETSGYRVENLHWDGTSDNGTELDNGIYVYKVIVRTAANEVTDDFEKLVILR